MLMLPGSDVGYATSGTDAASRRICCWQYCRRLPCSGRGNYAASGTDVGYAATRTDSEGTDPRRRASMDGIAGVGVGGTGLVVGTGQYQVSLLLRLRVPAMRLCSSTDHGGRGRVAFGMQGRISVAVPVLRRAYRGTRSVRGAIRNPLGQSAVELYVSWYPFKYCCWDMMVATQ
eukprot:1115874-Rhodomonas_salina.1